MKSGEGNDGTLGVGLTHSRGVAGAMLGDTDGRVIEGVSDQLQTERETSGVLRDASWVETRLSVISEMARTNSGCRFSNVAYLLSEDYLARCFWELEKGAAPGNLDGDFLAEQDVADALRELDPLWDELFPVEQHRVFRALVERIVVSSAGLDIRLRADGIHSIVAEVKGKDTERTIAA